jgi:hypothetical protein
MRVPTQGSGEKLATRVRPKQAPASERNAAYELVSRKRTSDAEQEARYRKVHEAERAAVAAQHKVREAKGDKAFERAQAARDKAKAAHEKAREDFHSSLTKPKPAEAAKPKRTATSKAEAAAAKERVKGYVKVAIGGRKPGDAGAQERFRYAGSTKRDATGFKKGQVERDVTLASGERGKLPDSGYIKGSHAVVPSARGKGKHDLIETSTGLAFGHNLPLTRAKEIVNALHKRKINMADYPAMDSKQQARVRKYVKSMTARA